MVQHLLQNGLMAVPKRFIQPLEKRVSQTPRKVDNGLLLPVVDLSSMEDYQGRELCAGGESWRPSGADGCEHGLWVEVLRPASGREVKSIEWGRFRGVAMAMAVCSRTTSASSQIGMPD